MSVLPRPVPAHVRGPAGPVPRSSWSAAPEPAAAMAALRWLTFVPVAAVTGLLLLSVVAPGAARTVAVPLAVVGALVGVPHGAVDHLIPWWWGGSVPGAGRGPVAIGLFGLAYAGVAALALTAFLFVPTPALVAFLVLSALHFGRGEVATSAERAGRPAPGFRTDQLISLAHGLVVVGMLLWARPAQVGPLLRPLSPWLADASTRSRPVGLVLVAAVVLAGLVVLLRAGRRGEAAELGLLAVTFTVAPPLAAFGVYFGAWHALRHTGRLLDLARGRRMATGHPDRGWGPSGALLARAAALPTLGALATMVALFLARDLASLQAEVGVLLALTFPHAAVVWALDRHESLDRHDAGDRPVEAGNRWPVRAPVPAPVRRS